MVRLYDATVMHARLKPKRHHFSHAAFAFGIRVEALENPGRGLWLLGRRWSPYDFRDQDFLPPGEIFGPEGVRQDFGREGDGLEARVRAFCAAHGHVLPERAAIRLIAMPRAFGQSYNPVVFFVITVDGRLDSGIAEVHNTFGERKAWFLGPECRREEHDGDPYLQLRAPKRFYVSPFSGLDTEFEFTLREPAGVLSVTVDHYEGGEKTLVSSWSGPQVPLTDARLLWLTLKSPLLVLKVTVLIHLHAAWLWLARRLPFRRKRDDIDLQRGLRHPSPEIAGRP
ncbi:MAG: DUF1365 domain-containing protein [Opitutales bacterium]